MKKFLISCFGCLVAFFGCLFSVGSISSINNLSDFKSLDRLAVETATNEYTFYFDLEVNYYSPLDYSIATLDQNSEIYYITRTGLINVSNLVDFAVSEGESNFSFSSLDINDDNDNYIGNANWLGLFVSKYSFNYTNNGFTFSSNTWYGLYTEDFQNLVYYEILGFKLIHPYSIEPLDDINNKLSVYIGNLTSLPSDVPVPPSPPSNNFLDDISSTINGVIDWFVDLFNGLSDIFVITDSSGAFVGFSLWGNVLFIQVSLGLVIIVLRWVISLIKGV